MIAAARGGRIELVDDLLRAGTRPTQRDFTTGDTPIHVASALGYADIVSLLLRAGAEVDEKNAKGRTPLLLAAERGHVPVVRALLAAGAIVNLLSCEGGASALALACRGGHVRSTGVILDNSLDRGLFHVGFFCTPLYEAAMANHPLCISALVDAGADVGAAGNSTSWKRTPLHCAAENGCTEAVSALLRHGAAKDARDDSGQEGCTPLHLAITGQHMTVVEELLSAGADISMHDAYGLEYVAVAVGLGCVVETRMSDGHGR